MVTSNKKIRPIWPFISLIVLLSFLSKSEGKNILFFFGMSTYSHRITAWPLAVKLAEEGHSVTFLQNVKGKDPHPNITDFVPDSSHSPVPPDFVELRAKAGKTLPYLMAFMLPQIATSVCEQLLSSQKNLDWINSNKFDYIVIDALFNDCGYALAWKWNAKTIVFTTSHSAPWFTDAFGLPDDSNSVSNMLFTVDMPLGFFGRVHAALSNLFFYSIREYLFLSPITKLLREKLNLPEIPAVTELQKNTSLILLNTHFSEEIPSALPPFVVPVGGMHVSGEVKSLPKNMEEFIKDSPEGFIYVSFGSEADLAKSPKYLQQIFFNAMKNSKVKFLWKWGGDRPEEMPENVLSSKWMPQQDVLGHPKCKGFITHAGLLGIQEAIYHGVPMIAFPVFAEQDYNAERIDRTGRGIRLELGTLKQSDLENAINQLLTNPSFRMTMQITSKRFKDRKESPVELAMWWVHYVFRHEDDTSFMRPLGIHQYWFQRRQLDVWVFISFSFVLASYVFVKLFVKLIKFCCFKQKNQIENINIKKHK